LEVGQAITILYYAVRCSTELKGLTHFC